MATNFPASLDSLTNPTSSDSLNSPSHSAQHANSNDAIEALQAKVGVDSSAVTTSLDYKIAQLEALGGYTDYSGSVTLTNWTLGNAVVEAWYTQVNELVHFFGTIEFGSTSAYSGTLVVDLPIACETYYIYGPNGTAIAEDGGTTRYMCLATSSGGTALAFRAFDHSVGTYSRMATVNATAPFTWTTGDKIAWSFVYKAA